LHGCPGVEVFFTVFCFINVVTGGVGGGETTNTWIFCGWAKRPPLDLSCRDLQTCDLKELRESSEPIGGEPPTFGDAIFPKQVIPSVAHVRL